MLVCHYTRGALVTIFPRHYTQKSEGRRKKNHYRLQPVLSAVIIAAHPGAGGAASYTGPYRKRICDQRRF